MTTKPRIVIITTPGGAKRDFAHILNEETGGKVALVIVQKERMRKLSDRIGRFVRKVSLASLPREIYSFLRFRFDARLREAIGFSKHRSPVTYAHPELEPETVTTFDINSDLIYARIKEVAPALIVIWGGLIVRPRIISLAPLAINMHHGYCPYYRGTNCYFHALLNDDLSHIGVTIHEATETVDAGGIYHVIPADTTKRPSEFFREMNDRAFRAYLDIVKRLLSGERVPTTSQDLSRGRNYLLREWTYTKRYRTAEKLLALETRV